MPLQVPPEIAAALKQQAIQEQSKYSVVFEIFKILLPMQIELGAKTVAENSIAVAEVFHDVINADRQAWREKNERTSV